MRLAVSSREKSGAQVKGGGKDAHQLDIFTR